MNHEAWIKAVLPDSAPRILGLPLVPYTLGHELVLWRWNSPLIFKEKLDFDKEEDWDAFFKAVLLCSEPFDDPRHILNSRWLSLFSWFWGRRCRKLNLALAFKRFEEYRFRFLWMPDLNQSAGSRKAEAPWPIMTLAEIMAEFHCSKEVALHEPLSFWTALHCAKLEREGKLDLFSDEHRALFSKLREMEEKGEEAFNE